MFPFVVTGSSKEANLSLLGFRVSLIQPKLSQSTAFMHTSDSFYFADIYTSAQNEICSVVTYWNSACLSKSKSNIITLYLAMNTSLTIWSKIQVHTQAWFISLSSLYLLWQCFSIKHMESLSICNCNFLRV